MESLGSEMITVLYEVEIQGKMTRMRKGVHVSDLDACLRLYHYATAVSSQQDEQQPGRSSGGSSAAGSGEGALEWSLSRVVEEGQMPPAAPRAAPTTCIAPTAWLAPAAVARTARAACCSRTARRCKHVLNGVEIETGLRSRGHAIGSGWLRLGWVES